MGYINAPIVEAVIEFVVVLPPGVGLPELAAAHHGEEGRYPAVHNRVAMENRVEVADGAIATNAHTKQVGYQYQSADGSYSFHWTLNNFSFSRNAPYHRWEDFSAEAWRLWSIYRSHAMPESISRIGVRYINRIVVPQMQVEIKDYLRTFPEIAPDLPQTFANYFMQIAIPLESYGAVANVVSGLEAVTAESVAFILDIDCSKEPSINGVLRADDDEHIMEHLSSLRDAKNQVFEASITDLTRELFA